MHSPTHRPAAFSLVELMIVVALMGILAGMVIPHFQPPLNEQLRGTASVVAADLDYARSLAVTNNSAYRLTFSTAENRYVLTHAGTNAALDALPATPFRPRGDAPHEHTCDLDQLPHLGATVYLHAVVKHTTSLERVGDVEFGPLGGTTRPEPTVVWLLCGADTSRRFLPLTIDPITGLVSVGEIQMTVPVVTGLEVSP